MNPHVSCSTLDDYSSIVSFLTNISTQETLERENVKFSSRALLIGSRAARIHKETIRNWADVSLDSDWDFITRLPQTLELLAGPISTQALRWRLSIWHSQTSTTDIQPSNIHDLVLVIVLSDTQILEIEIVDSRFQNQTSLMLLDDMNSGENPTELTPIGEATVCSLPYLVALKMSHACFSIHWQKTIKDLLHLSVKIDDGDPLQTFIRQRYIETGVRAFDKQVIIQGDSLSLLTHLRKEVAPLLNLDGSLLLLSTETAFKALSSEERMEYLELEVLTQLLTLQDVSATHLDFDDETLLQAARIVCCCTLYHSEAKLFFLNHIQHILRHLQHERLHELGNSCLEALKHALASLEAQKCAAEDVLTRAIVSKPTHSNIQQQESLLPSFSSPLALPLDLLIELASFFSDHAFIIKLALCHSALRSLILHDSSTAANGFWHRLCQISYGKILQKASEIRSEAGQPLWSTENAFSWRKLHQFILNARQRRISTRNQGGQIKISNISTVMAKLSGKGQSSLLQNVTPALEKEINFILEYSNVTLYSKSQRSDAYDDPAFLIYEVTLQVLLPSLRQLIIQWKVEEDRRFYVSGDSKTDGRPAMNCSLTMVENGQAIASQSFTEDWYYAVPVQVGLSADFLNTSTFWNAIMVQLSPESSRILNVFAIGNLR